MGKPSMFSSNYKQQLKRRRLNKVLFVLLIISVAVVGGQFYLRGHNVTIVKDIQNSKIAKSISNIHISDWWSKIKGKFASKDKEEVAQVTPPKKPAAVTPTINTTTPAGVKNSSNTEENVYQYSYTAKDSKVYTVLYKKSGANIEFTGFKDNTNTSDYNISVDKSLVVFDIKAENSIILCNASGEFKVISRDYYVTSSAHTKVFKETVVSTYKNYIWAVKPYFTSDGRVVYVSKLPYMKSSNGTLYLWSVKLDGSNHQKITKVGKDLTKISYGGFDEKNRLRVIVNGKTQYLPNGSYMLYNK